ncbi:PE-PPE domain-containing protein [Mycobacterium hubeiense]|uniref:PE-PPE domain-containing protein n=1 Tax=Mycobacterium hubeiense TaxID=1867256 RepID=UPI000C7F0F41|nr:PE-PPE domain-containing protein [Mycobacterium sp. QGD 101]
MARHRLFCVPGTWEAVAAANGGPITPAAEIGMLKGITDVLDRTVFDIVYVNYPASFGPIPGGGQDLLDALGNPSYLKSRDMGVAEVKRLIGEHRGSFGLLGYSQGAAVVSLVGRELVSGSLTARQRDCRWVHAIGSPHRGRGRTFHLGNQLAYQGISGDNITMAGTIDWFDYCLPGDIYGNADIFGTYLKQGYDLVTPLSLVDPFSMIATIAMNIARWAQTGELGPVSLFRLVKTGFDLGVFLRDFPHDKYAVTDIIPGRTALQHSANHLNFWGPRVPDVVNL